MVIYTNKTCSKIEIAGKFEQFEQLSFSSLQLITKKIAAIKNCEIVGWQNVNDLITSSFVNFGVFQREFLCNYSVYQARSFRDNCMTTLCSFEYLEILFY